MISRNARFTVVALLLAGTALFLHARSDRRFVPPRTALASFPIALKSWVGTNVPIPPGEFLQRTYQDRTTGQSDVDLYVAYLPQDCLVGSGWSPVESGTTTLAFAGAAPFSANRYLIAKGPDRQLVLFWYSARGRRVASEDWMDWCLVFDALRLNRSDNALIRMNTELQSGEKPAEAERHLLAFAGLVNPLLKSYIPR